MADPVYRRLTRAYTRSGLAIVAAGRASLWLADDHLLQVETALFTESYKRFYFRDIQGITVARTRRRAFWNWMLTGPTLFCLVWWISILVTDPFSPLSFLGGITTLLFGLPLIINNVMGSTCICQIRTAVQTEELPALSRWRRARRVLERIRPLIVAAQGEVPPEEAPEQLRRLAQTGPAGAGGQTESANPAMEGSGASPAGTF